MAQQVADLINEQNQLTVQYTATRVLKDEDRYILCVEGSRLLGVVEIKLVQWYQAEIAHVSVAVKRKRIGTWLVERAEVRAKELGARITQCTIRVGNVESEGLFEKLQYRPAVKFLNEQSGNAVSVYQKSLVPVPESV